MPSQPVLLSPSVAATFCNLDLTAVLVRGAVLQRRIDRDVRQQQT